MSQTVHRAENVQLARDELLRVALELVQLHAPNDPVVQKAVLALNSARSLILGLPLGPLTDDIIRRAIFHDPLMHAVYHRGIEEGRRRAETRL